MSSPSALQCLETEIEAMEVNTRHGRGHGSKCGKKKKCFLGEAELYRSLKKSKISSTPQ